LQSQSIKGEIWGKEISGFNSREIRKRCAKLFWREEQSQKKESIQQSNILKHKELRREKSLEAKVWRSKFEIYV